MTNDFARKHSDEYSEFVVTNLSDGSIVRPAVYMDKGRWKKVLVGALTRCFLHVVDALLHIPISSIFKAAMGDAGGPANHIRFPLCCGLCITSYN